MSVQLAARVGSTSEAAPVAATERLVVLVHGLMETERRWQADERPGLMDALSELPDVTLLTVRYNTGLPVAVNGAHLAGRLEELCAGRPIPVASIALVGHSMGGLVVRAACAAAANQGHGWVESVTDLITIGSPHGGAPLGRWASILARGLRVAAVTEPLAAFIDGRSRGIRDLEVDTSRTLDVPGHVRQHFVAGVVTADPSHPVGALVGDLMVRPASGTGGAHVEPTTAVVLGGVHHFDLLHDEAVIGQVLEWVGAE